ncbi:MFS transporter [Streptomyces sp. NPDC058296]|uniref:MFS transporter n=1 Tax=Streptomyces sp. NPDC058296 TaxID=3346432 RepID=UPI0036E30822
MCALTGALVYGAVDSRFRRWPVFTIAFLIGGLPRFAVAAFTDTFAPLAMIMAVEGLAFGVLNPIMATVTYETAPEELRSRVLSATTASVQVITPMGGLAAGFLVDAAGLPCTLLTVGSAYLLATLCPVIFPAWRQMDRTGSPQDWAEGSPQRGSGSRRVWRRGLFVPGLSSADEPPPGTPRPPQRGQHGTGGRPFRPCVWPDRTEELDVRRAPPCGDTFVDGTPARRPGTGL